MIPMELLVGAVSTLLGWGGTLLSMKVKANAEAQKLLIERATLQEKIHQSAREFGKQPGVAFTRRIIALSCVFAIVVWPLVFAPLFGVPVVHGWTEYVGGFWPFTSGKERMVWHMVEGGALVITPLHTNLMTAIVGLYFGAAISQNARTK
jgi:hypothetical protein